MDEARVIYRPQTSDLQFLEQNSSAMARAGIFLPHLDQRINLLNYIRIAEDVAANLSGLPLPEGQNAPARTLDWGCGYGQMTWLLKNRGLAVTSFDIGPDDTPLPDMPLCSELKVVRSTHPTNLPFADACFDAVMSCGVLEHVDECSGTPGNESKSLDEIARVLSPNGKFLIYQLPQKAAWQEAVVRRFKLGYAHPRRYSEAEIVAILAGAGFTVTRLKRANLVPKNLTGMPMALRKAYSKFTPLLLVLDRILCTIPVLNRIAGVFEIVAVKNKAG